MEKKISKNQKMYPHRFGCSQNHPKVPKWGQFFYSSESRQNDFENITLLNKCRILLSNVRFSTLFRHLSDRLNETQPKFILFYLKKRKRKNN